METSPNSKPLQTCGVRGREVERRPRNLKVPSAIPSCGCKLKDFHWPKHSALVLVKFPQEEESRKISIKLQDLVSQSMQKKYVYTHTHTKMQTTILD